MAHATVAGLPVSVGFYTAFVLSVSSTTTLAILTGLLLIIAAALRLGFVANFISSPVLTGFKAGIGLVIVLDQVPKLFGLHIAKEGFFRDILSLLQHLPDTSVITALVGIVALGLLLLMERVWPHSPAPLAVVGAAIAVSWLFGLSAHGVSIVGHIPQALPSLTLPSVDLIRQLLPGAIGIALMSFTETIAAGRAFAALSDPPIRPNPDDETCDGLLTVRPEGRLFFVNVQQVADRVRELVIEASGHRVLPSSTVRTGIDHCQNSAASPSRKRPELRPEGI
jgi:SulP family sulfate permease